MQQKKETNNSEYFIFGSKNHSLNIHCSQAHTENLLQYDQERETQEEHHFEILILNRRSSTRFINPIFIKLLVNQDHYVA